MWNRHPSGTSLNGDVSWNIPLEISILTWTWSFETSHPEKWLELLRVFRDTVQLRAFEIIGIIRLVVYFSYDQSIRQVKQKLCCYESRWQVTTAHKETGRCFWLHKTENNTSAVQLGESIETPQRSEWCVDCFCVQVVYWPRLKKKNKNKNKKQQQFYFLSSVFRSDSKHNKPFVLDLVWTKNKSVAMKYIQMRQDFLVICCPLQAL